MFEESLKYQKPKIILFNADELFFTKQTSYGNSSKVYDVLHQYGLEDNRSQIEQGKCQVKMEHIIDTLHAFPKDKVMMISRKRYEAYRKMIDDIINSLK